ncbi:MAG: Got1/Sft2-like family vesicle transport protein, partial [Planctomycetaceae bacterium]|nr:Got1/Sft2-like family vesicle transport protein [Planctomycetaceae bacterium]
MKRTFPLIITAVSGFILIAAFFIPFAQTFGEIAAIWFDLLAAIAFILGGGNLLKQHLKKVSDRKKGWAFSVIVVVSFLVTLFFGLTKWGTTPLGKTEFLGESFVEYPIDELPITSIPGNIPPRGDGEPLPASVRRQISHSDVPLDLVTYDEFDEPYPLPVRQQDSLESGQVIFRGWMTESQRDDLFKYQDDLLWLATVEELFEASQPPMELKGSLTYHSDQGALSFKGTMSPEQEAVFRKLLGDEPHAKSAVDQLASASRTEHSIEVPIVPDGFKIPESHQKRVSLRGQTLTTVGPIDTGLRNQMSSVWTNPKHLRMFSLEQGQRLLAEIEDEKRGGPLTDEQREEFNKKLNSLVVPPEVFIMQLNAAGVAKPGKKSYADLYKEYREGKRFLEREIPPKTPSIELNSDQEELATRFVKDSSYSVEQFKTDLQNAGPTNESILDQVDNFVRSLPEEGTFLKELCLVLSTRNGAVRPDMLTSEQRQFLTQRYRIEYAWQQAIGELAIKAHVTKYPMSASYEENGSPFWWLYF